MKKKMIKNNTGYTWRFFRAGGFDQVRIDSAQDLINIEKLDQKLWVALACPVDNVHFDTTTLQMIDCDGDRRIRANELIAAIKWTVKNLKNPDELIENKDGISLDSINDSTDEGKKIFQTVRSSLKLLGKDENGSISVEEIQNLEKSFSDKVFNGDGIITVDTASDEEHKKLINDIIAVSGSVIDRSGKPGIDTRIVEDFFTEAQKYIVWRMEIHKDQSVLPLGEKTEPAFEVLNKVKNKIDDFFTRCAIAGYDDRAIVHLNGGDSAFLSCVTQPLTIDCDALSSLPISIVKPHGVLPLSGDINPSWQKSIGELIGEVIIPLYGIKKDLTYMEWKEICSLFEPLFSWQKRKPSSAIHTLGQDRIEEILNSNMKTEILSLIEQDRFESVSFESIKALEKLIRLKRDLYVLSKNFVNFKDFYTKGSSSIFQAGTLYLDQRSCHLCIKIDDPNKHSLMASMAGTYLVYCECKRKDEAKNIIIVAAFTNGDSDNLMVGRNGVFYDRSGKDWDATIIKIIDNPISLRQAFWLPYKSFVRMIESQVAKRAMDAEVQSTTKLSQAALATANVDKVKTGPAVPQKKLDVGIVAALGVAAGALGTFVATLFGYIAGIVKLGPLAIAGSILGLIALISGPSIILAFIKLRKRNLGPILDAGGWAVNAKAQISVPFGALLTHTATLPAGSQRDLIDPYAERKSPWSKIIIVLLVLYLAYISLNHVGLVNKWSNGLIGIKREWVFKDLFQKKSPDSVIPVTQP